MPRLAAFATGLDSAWDKTISLLLTASIVVIAWRRFPRLTICAVLIQPIANAAWASDWTTFFYDGATGEFSLLLSGFLLRVVWRFNFVLIFLSHLILTLLSTVLLFLYKGGPTYRWEALPLVLAPLCVFPAARLIRWVLKGGRDSETPDRRISVH